MTRSHLQERLFTLYLRLNGYFTTSLIVHSPNNKEVEGEIDLIGVRFPNHAQPDREIDCCEYLEIPKTNKIDIIVGEVKGGKNPLQFNESLRLHDTTVMKMLQWIGVLSTEEISEVSGAFRAEIQLKNLQSCGPFPVIERDNFTIRPIIFAPDRKRQAPNQIHFLTADQIIAFYWKCFRPDTRRIDCETDYRAINNWGEQYDRIVGYYKNPNLNASGDIKNLYAHFNV